MTEARRPLLDLYPNRGLAFVRGEGSHLITRDGDRYLDLMTNYGVSILGHGHPALVSALSCQLEALPTLHSSFGNDVRLRAAVALLARVPVPGGSVCWTNSGAEANEAALKFAATATGRTGFVACAGGYHGKTLGALSVTHAAKYRTGLAGLLTNCRWAAFGSVASIDAAIGDDTAAVIIEPIQGESGVIVPPDGFLRDVADLCGRRGVLLIVDEIQTGVGRTGSFTVCEREGVTPDLLCLGKGLAGGVPVGATIVGPGVAEYLFRGLHTSTFGGNPLAAAGVLAVLSVVTPDLLATVEDRGRRFREQLAVAGLPVRGRGLMVGVQVGPGRDSLLKALQKDRVLAIPAAEDVVRFLPPLVIDGHDLEAGAGRFVEAAARQANAAP